MRYISIKSGEDAMRYIDPEGVYSVTTSMSEGVFEVKIVSKNGEETYLSGAAAVMFEIQWQMWMNKFKITIHTETN